MQKVTKYYLKPISPTEAQDLRGNVFHHPQCKEWKAKFAQIKQNHCSYHGRSCCYKNALNIKGKS